MKASTTAWPPLVVTGLLMLLLATSTDIPFSTRMPLVSLEFFTVILYNIIRSFSVCYVNSSLLVPHKVRDYFDNFSVFLPFFTSAAKPQTKERVPTFLIPLDGSGKPYQKTRKSSPRPITIRCGHLPPFVP